MGYKHKLQYSLYFSRPVLATPVLQCHLSMKPWQRIRFEKELRRKIKGDLLFDHLSRLIYSTDASLYQIEPLGVVLPRTVEEAVQAVRTAAKYHVAVLPRGGGTSLAGQTVSSGLVVDCSKYLTRVLEVNSEQHWVRVEPGVVLDGLNDFLRPYNDHFAPDVATSSRANIGGMIGNNSSGMRSIRYGKTINHTLELSVVLSTGEQLLLRSLNRQELEEKCSRANREGEIYRGIRQVIERNREEILRRYPKVMRRVSGYNLDALFDENNFNLARLIVGSEGTLALVTEAKLNLEPVPKTRVVSVLHFDDLIQAVKAVPSILDHHPSTVEILDQHSLELARSNPTTAPLCAQFLQGTPRAILIVEFSGESEQETHSALQRMNVDLAHHPSVFAVQNAIETSAQQVIWTVRKHALGILLAQKGDAKPLPFIEDACVPVEHLSQYILRVLEICRRYGAPVALYAHASAGVIHVRPILNLKQQGDVDHLRAISAETFELICEYGGSWSGEHGDGLVRSYKNREFFGDQLYEAFREVKRIFDPPGLMNPGKIVDSQDIHQNLRIHPGYHAHFPATYFRFEEEQGFDRAIEMCTGVGHCRKTSSGTMCPSYMATRDEEHSTRGRANALRMAMSGKLGPNGLTSHRLYQVLDLCLECKACKMECPSNVDMAKLKSEFLAHYHIQHGLPLKTRLVSGLRETAEQTSRFPRLANFVIGTPIARWLLEKLAGIDRRRNLPILARQTFAKWFREHHRPTQSSGTREHVALFADTFVNFYEPRVGIAATRLLEELGYRVLLADIGCCGRPLISSGQLERAKKRGDRLLKRLSQYTAKHIPVVVLEPSCFSAFEDEYLDLLQDQNLCRQVARHTLTLEQFLVREDVWPRLKEKMGRGPARILFHGHCQQKALVSCQDSMKVLQALAVTRTTEIDSGCCGMAGSFGYARNHYAISEQIGERRLFPAIRGITADTEIVASGFSCRSQIQHFTGRRALHLAELLAQHLG